MQITAFKSATEVAEALLADRSVTVPGFRIALTGQQVSDRRYDLSSVSDRIGADTRHLIDATALTDMCEAGRLLRASLHHEAATLARNLFNENCISHSTSETV